MISDKADGVRNTHIKLHASVSFLFNLLSDFLLLELLKLEGCRHGLGLPVQPDVHEEAMHVGAEERSTCGRRKKGNVIIFVLNYYSDIHNYEY